MKEDLTGLAKEVEAVFEKHFKGRTAIAIAFTLPSDRSEVHWVTNVSRNDGIKLFQDTAKRMRLEIN